MAKHPLWKLRAIRCAAICLVAAVTACSTVDSEPGDDTGGNSGPPRENSAQTPIEAVKNTAPLFPGFSQLNYFAGAYFDFSWRYTSSSNGTGNPVKQGIIRLEFIDSVDVSFTNLGILTLYKTQTSNLSGDTFPLGWPAYDYMAAKDGRIYIGRTENDGSITLAILFDAADGTVYESGFIGFLADERPDTVTPGKIHNAFINIPAVEVSEAYLDPKCKSVSEQPVCGDQGHEYDVREYYIPNIGFGGFHRAGYSEFTGGGASDYYTSNMQVGITATNVHDLGALR